MWIYPIWFRSNVFSTFQHFQARTENETGHTIVKFCTNHSGKFTSLAFEKFLLDNSIQHQFLTLYTPQQNGCAKQLNKTILAGVRCMLIKAGMLSQWSAKAALTYLYIKNRLPHSAIGEAVPEHLYTGTLPDVSHLRVFGCAAWVTILRHACHKLEAPDVKMVHLGCNDKHKAWRFWDPQTGKVHMTCDVHW
ncbi:hypothetical protein ACM66B_004607 [Microbotryomycetes sp. NB124-2]